MIPALCLSLPLLAPAQQEAAPAWEWRELERGPETIPWALVLPEDHQPGDVRPVLVALPPGAGDRDMVEAGLGLYWAQLALERGWAVASPVRPRQETSERARSTWDLLAQALAAELEIEGGRMYLAGISNGGRAAFGAAATDPDRWSGLLVAPGRIDPEDAERVARIAELPVRLFVGAEDPDWLAGSRAARDGLIALGAADVRLDVVEDAEHVLPRAAAARLHEALEELRARAQERAQAVAAIELVLGDFHAAAAEADGPRYFAHFAPGAVYLGTDASERWSVAEFRTYAEPHFAAGTGWTYVLVERHVGLAPDGRTAWFDERLDNAKYGRVRGSGVLVLTGGRWRIAQYNLAFAVPNELAPDLVERIRGLGR